MKNVSSFILALLMSCTFFTHDASAQIISNACGTWNQVATGCVGECGSSSVISTTAFCRDAIADQVNYCVRNEGSNLCPNTGAFVVIFVNGNLVASSIITTVGSSVNFSAKCGSAVKVITYTYPLNNNIDCVRLGELTVGLRRQPNS